MHQNQGLERVKGIEPSYEAWEAAVLPLNYTRGRARFYRALVPDQRTARQLPYWHCILSTSPFMHATV